tara:strand:- start:825 stop:1520 length:696 start_codon:yes stop_codon:yes gene_type:complete
MVTLNPTQLTLLISLLVISLSTACGDDDDGGTNIIFVGPGASDTNSGTGADLSDEPTVPDNESSAGDSVIDDQQPQPELDPEPEPEPEADPIDERGPPELFGSALSDDVQFVDFEDLLTDPDTYANQLIQTEGTIRQVCQRRGCWMEIRSSDNPSSENMNIRFVDYAFFVPLDSRGALVRVQGTPSVQRLSAAEVQELIAEGYDPGVVRDDGTAVVIRFMASGVMMWNRAD